MKGIVFTEFLDMVGNRFSPALAESIVEDSDLASQGAYTSLGTYPFEEMAQLVTRLSEETQIPLPELLRSFGRYLFPRFADLYPQFVREDVTCFEFLQLVEHYIHIEVRKLYPDAELPSFDYDTSVEDRLVMTYRSTRPLGDLALGLLTGCVEHFRAPVRIEAEDLSQEGEGTVMRFVLTVDPSVTWPEPGSADHGASDGVPNAPLADDETLGTRLSKSIENLDDARSAVEQLSRQLRRERQARMSLEKIAEEKTRDLYDSNGKLESTLGYLRTIIDTMVDGLLVIDREGIIQLASQSSLELLGFASVDQLLHQPAAAVLSKSMLDLVTECDAQQEQRQARIEAADRIHRVLDAVACPIRGDGQYMGLVVIVRDISAEVTMAKQRSMTEMVAGVAHELNTPLSVVDMAARIIQDTVSEDALANLKTMDEDDLEDLVDSLVDSCKLITQNTKRVAELIESFKKLSVNLLGHERETVDLSEFIELIVVPLEMSTKKLVVEVDDQLAESEREWVGYPSHLVQVLTYVFMNVVEHAYPGEPMCKSKLTISVSPDGKSFVLVVRDYGVGIAPDSLPKIFDAFFTSNRGQSKGLGLSIAHNIVVEGWKGSLTADSVVGEGTTITMSFPRKLA